VDQELLQLQWIAVPGTELEAVLTFWTSTQAKPRSNLKLLRMTCSAGRATRATPTHLWTCSLFLRNKKSPNLFLTQCSGTSRSNSSNRWPWCSSNKWCSRWWRSSSNKTSSRRPRETTWAVVKWVVSNSNSLRSASKTSNKTMLSNLISSRIRAWLLLNNPNKITRRHLLICSTDSVC